MPSITARFRWTLDDLNAGRKQIEKLIYGSQTRQNFTALGVYGIFTCVFWWLTNGKVPLFVGAIVFVMISMVFPISFLAVKLVNRSAIRRYFAKLPDADHDIVWITSPQGIETSTPNSKSETQWAAYQTVVATPDGFLFQTNSQIVHFIPTRAFETPADIENLKTLARQHAREFRELK